MGRLPQEHLHQTIQTNKDWSHLSITHLIFATYAANLCWLSAQYPVITTMWRKKNSHRNMQPINQNFQ